jgi:hypothetical protein
MSLHHRDTTWLEEKYIIAARRCPWLLPISTKPKCPVSTVLNRGFWLLSDSCGNTSILLYLHHIQGSTDDETRYVLFDPIKHIYASTAMKMRVCRVPQLLPLYRRCCAAGRYKVCPGHAASWSIPWAEGCSWLCISYSQADKFNSSCGQGTVRGSDAPATGFPWPDSCSPAGSGWRRHAYRGGHKVYNSTSDFFPRTYIEESTKVYRANSL